MQCLAFAILFVVHCQRTQVTKPAHQDCIYNQLGAVHTAAIAQSQCARITAEEVEDEGQ